ncbi:hypothetical protein C8F01DRAFT_1365861 [Mycena amicta]|nr:hypothetical protein C8F01DRAFT_1365861 [Mycena amicta]
MSSNLPSLSATTPPAPKLTMTGPRAGLWRLECLHAYFYHHFTNDISRPPVLAAAALAPSVTTAATRAPQATTALPHMQQPHIPPLAVPTHSLQDPLWRARQQRPMSQTPRGNPTLFSISFAPVLGRPRTLPISPIARLFPLPSSSSPSPPPASTFVIVAISPGRPPARSSIVVFIALDPKSGVVSIELFQPKLHRPVQRQ